ncbi:hypothetical protein MXB_3605 [Myxobolus squamalis]|nr:hypothetical protein MXB_3605 [Myxobolus squamalis]
MELGEAGDAYFVRFTGPCNCEDCKSTQSLDNIPIAARLDDQNNEACALRNKLDISTLYDSDIK